MALNPFCEIALEEALRLKDDKIVEEVTVVAVGPKEWRDILRTGLSMGACKAIHCVTEDQSYRQLQIAKVLAALANRENCDVIFLGKQSVDQDANMTGQLLAGLLNWPQGTFASKVVIDEKQKKINVDREVDRVELRLPAVVTCDLHLNTPRYTSLKGIMAGKKKNIEEVTPEQLDIDMSSEIDTVRVMQKQNVRKKVMLSNVDELYEVIRQHTK